MRCEAAIVPHTTAVRRAARSFMRAVHSRRRPVCGPTVTVVRPSIRPSSSPVHTSMARAGRGMENDSCCGVSCQFKRHTKRRSFKSTTPTRNVSSSNLAATPVGGSSVRSIASRAGGIAVKSSPERIIPPLAKIAVAWKRNSFVRKVAGEHDGIRIVPPETTVLPVAHQVLPCRRLDAFPAHA